MSILEMFHQQILAFHIAIADDCNRAAQPGQSDAIALKLRNNALALAKLQLAMLAFDPGLPPDPGPGREQHDVTAPPPSPEPIEVFSSSSEPEHMLTGDALSRFVSRRLEADESPHDVWQDLQDDEPIKHRRNPVLPKADFRSPSS